MTTPTITINAIIADHAALIEETVAACVAAGITDAEGIQDALVAAHQRQRSRMDEMLGALHSARMSGGERPAWYQHAAQALYAR